MDILTVYMISIMVLVPVYSAVSCGMVVGLSLQDCLSREERDLKRILLVYLSVSATGWLVTFCYQFYPSLFVRLNVVCLLCFVLPSIFFYRIVRFLTCCSPAAAIFCCFSGCSGCCAAPAGAGSR